ncbi:MAG: hypothetical protein ACOYXT_24015, partial [Bacteroidota bacterium]
QEKDAEGFQLVREDGDIRIYERWIIFPKSNPPIKAREVKGDWFVSASLEDAAAMLGDEKKITQWQDHVTEFKVYPQNDTVWFEYSYHDIPWPVSDQDHFLEYNLKEKNPNELFITFESKVNNLLAPVREGVTRMQLSGSWRLTQVNSQKVKVSYRILSKPIGIPRIFTDPVIRNNLMSTIKAYTKVLEGAK